MAETKPPSDHPDLIVPPPVWPAIALVLAIALEWLAPIRFLAEGLGWQFWLGLALSVLAIGIAIMAARAFHRAGTQVDPGRPSTTVVAGGPFAVVRNPIYVGFLLLLAGVSLVVGLAWGLLLIPALWLSLHFFVVVREERYLHGKFGETYDAYRRKVKRWGLF
ncbi:MAG TPA: isoprenylcysteine carboxylmethyltransferase family protein [Devosiaceae bacterium]|nr:isoprenylcysteine carboxylmethyltransferase family protein [Devosiaceae bacterium]